MMWRAVLTIRPSTGGSFCRSSTTVRKGRFSTNIRTSALCSRGSVSVCRLIKTVSNGSIPRYRRGTRRRRWERRPRFAMLMAELLRVCAANCVSKCAANQVDQTPPWARKRRITPCYQCVGRGRLVHKMADRQGFEPWRRCRLHAFQACAFDHSATCPLYAVRQLNSAGCARTYTRISLPFKHVCHYFINLSRLSGTCLAPACASLKNQAFRTPAKASFTKQIIASGSARPYLVENNERGPCLNPFCEYWPFLPLRWP